VLWDGFAWMLVGMRLGWELGPRFVLGPTCGEISAVQASIRQCTQSGRFSRRLHPDDLRLMENELWALGVGASVSVLLASGL
jgi:hypothetical protein